MRSRLLGAAMSFLVLGGQALSGIPAAAASAPGAPTVVQELKHDRSGPLRSALAVQAPNDLGNRNYYAIRPRGLTSKAAVPPGPVQTAAGPSLMPSTSVNFEGIANIDGAVPPDTNGDIGPHNYVQWVNIRYQIFDRNGTSLLGPSPGNTLWSGFGGVCQTTNQGDPIVRYDRMADRWVFTQFAFNVDGLGNPLAPYVECLAVSTTGDPTASYYRYAYQISSTLFNDYPKLSVWPDGYYMTFNYFDPTQPAATQFQGAGVWAFDRSKMLNGQAASAVDFQTTSTYGGLLASDLDGSILPPTGSPNYVAAIDDPVSGSVALAGSTLFIWKFHVDWTTPANSTFGTAAHLPDFNLAVATYKWDPCGASQNCIPQPGTRVGLDPIADRLMNRLQYRHFADGHESLVASHTVGVGTSGNQAAVRWYEIRNLSTTPTIYQQGTYSPDANNRWMGSAAMDQSGDIGLGYSVSSSTVYPSIRYTGRLASDPLGSLPQGEATMVAGSGSQLTSYYRWGDYSMMAVDPTDDCTFWYTQEYYTTTSDRSWRTRIGSFKFPTCGVPTTPAGLTASAASSSQVNLSWSASTNATTYKVERSPDGSSGWTQIGTSSTTSYADIGLNQGTAYFYRVRATNATGDSGPSNVASARTSLSPSQAPQGNWVGTYGADGSALLGWNGSSDLASLPSTWSLSIDRGARWSWSGGTSDIRALESPDAASRRATCIYDGTQVKLHLTYSGTTTYTGTLHLYTIDWDWTTRRQSVAVDDGSGPSNVSLSVAFDQGLWITAPITVAPGGTVTITVDRGAGPNAVLSGVFLR